MTNEHSRSPSTPICQAYDACKKSDLSVDSRRRGLDAEGRPLDSDWSVVDWEPEAGPMVDLCHSGRD